MPEHTIAENLQRLQTAKTAIGNAITAKGGTVGANDGLEDFASDIANIPSGGGGEIFEVEMILNSSGTAFTASKTLQETIDAIEAGKQIDFSLTHDEKEADVICYGFYNVEVREAIFMIAFDGTTLFSIYWVGDEDATLNVQMPMIIAGTNQ